MKFVASFFCVEWFAAVLEKLNRILERWQCLLEEQRPIFEQSPPVIRTLAYFIRKSGTY